MSPSLQQPPRIINQMVEIGRLRAVVDASDPAVSIDQHELLGVKKGVGAVERRAETLVAREIAIAGEAVDGVAIACQELPSSRVDAALASKRGQHRGRIDV